MRSFFAGWLIFISCACFSESFAPAGGQLLTPAQRVDFLPVEQAYQLEVEIVNAQQVRVYWQIAENYYLYQHRFVFTAQDSQGPIDLQSTMPASLTHHDDYFGEVQIYYNSADITLNLQRSSQRATLSLISQGCADAGLCYPPYRQTFDLDFNTGVATPLSAPTVARVTAGDAQRDTSSNGALLYMLALAFVGGAILNLMPCVFPILSLKVLSFTNSTNQDRHLHSWVYTLGVVSSFVAVAALLIGLQQAGKAIGWGFQLQSPSFVIALAYLFVVMGLSLSGLMALGGSLMNAGSGLTTTGGLSGSFFTGVLAVIVASPCTAPFMGTALGFAVGQPPVTALLVFAALGAGMAAPLLLFSYSGAARALMPKPGPWMETLKQLLAFPLYATAIWLLWVAGRQTSVNTMAAALAGILVLALGLWLWDRRPWRRALALVCVVAAIGLGAAPELDPRSDRQTQRSASLVTWSEEAVAAARNAGQAVFVDVTADWCITCIANETAVLFTDDITQAFADHDVVYMVADWTNEDANIANLLQYHARNGIPFYLLYPADPAAAPLILPQLLTKRTVLEALQAVSPKNSDVTVISR